MLDGVESPELGIFVPADICSHSQNRNDVTAFFVDLVNENFGDCKLTLHGWGSLKVLMLLASLVNCTKMAEQSELVFGIGLLRAVKPGTHWQQS